MKKRVTVMLGLEKMFYVRKVVNIKKANGEKSSIIKWIEEAIQEKLDRDGMPEIENYTYDSRNKMLSMRQNSLQC